MVASGRRLADRHLQEPRWAPGLVNVLPSSRGRPAAALRQPRFHPLRQIWVFDRPVFLLMDSPASLLCLVILG